MQKIDIKNLLQAKKNSFPSIINVEVYRGQCPCACFHCPLGSTDRIKRSELFGCKEMSLKLFRKIVEEISSHDSALLRLHSVGEPTLWKNFYEALDIINKKNITSWIFTSAVTNNFKILEELCRNVDVIEVSVNSINNKDFLETKGVDAFEIVKRNIKYMSDFIIKNKLNRLLIVSRVESKNKTDDNNFIEFWKSSGLVDDAFIRKYINFNNYMSTDNHKSCLSTDSDLPKEPCLQHWARFNINVDGYAVTCYNNLFAKYLHPSIVLGDLNKHTISEIWKNEKIKLIRKAELKNDYSKCNDLPCKKCISARSVYTNLDENSSEYQLKKLESKRINNQKI